MGSKKGKASCSGPFALFTLGAMLLVIAVVFSIMFLGPEESEALPFLRPGVQSTCLSDTKGMLFKTRVSIVNKTTEGLNLTTYVFDRQPVPATFEDNVTIVFSGETTLQFNVPMIDGITVRYSLDVDTPTDVLYRSWAKRSRFSVYEKKGLQQFSDVINVTRTFPDATFRFTAKNPIHGTFNVSVVLQQWQIEPQQALANCSEYPCEWKYSNYNWGKVSLWFITVNEGNGTAQIDAKSYYKFVFCRFFQCFCSCFHLFVYLFLDSPAVWVTITVLLYVFFVVCFVAGCLLMHVTLKE